MGESGVYLGLAITAVLAVCMFFVILLAWATEKFSSRQAGQSWTQTEPSTTLRSVLQQISQTYSGRLLPGPMYETPRLAFDHQDTPVIVEANQFGQQPSPSPTYHVSLRFVWPDGDLRMDVYPDDLLSGLKKLIGIRDILVDDHDFDRMYMITGNDLVAVQKFLSPPVRELVTLIRGPRYSDSIHVRIVGGGLWISKPGVPGDYETITNLIELSLALYDAALEQPRAGIEFLDAGVITLDAPICQVCGESIVVPEVACTRCRTPHHRDCWHYFGGCSIYGCRSKECQPDSVTTIRG